MAFVVLEGIDGSGTTTQLQALNQRLAASGHSIMCTQEPSRGPLGALARAELSASSLSPDTLALLFAADRIDHVHREITPALEKGQVVLCDRYVVSSWVYQGLECPAEWIRAINSRAPWPDASILLDVSVDEAMRRIEARGLEKDRYETATALRQVRASYRRVFETETQNTAIVDGTGSVVDVTQRIIAAIQGLVPALQFG